MEPHLSAPNLGPEKSPVGYGQNSERVPLPPSLESAPETGVERAPERVEQRAETPPAAVNAAPILPPPIVAPAPLTPASQATTTPIVDDNPSVANDDDLIEKEWVDKAKKIIVETKDDPHRREQEVSKLQADYLRKRYGKELGASE